MTSFPPQFLDELKSRLRASDVIGRHVQLKKAGREWRGLSPFNKERTPSFYVNDEKMAFFDFSSGNSGDIIKFLMLHQNRTFPEAVEELAALAGMEVPRMTQADERKLSEREVLYKVLADASDFFQKALMEPEGAEARDYLRRRGVKRSSLEAFGLGYAPQGWDSLKRFFLGRGVDEKILVSAGLLKVRESDGSTYDGFRHRVMFPIFDGRGRVIAFGGRALEKDAPAKYLNSPETDVFHKGRVLYNFGRARTKLKGDAPLLVCEGYMDALALDAAGYAAVAPLGTALTEDQLRLLWRVQQAPVLCFDGDRAGRSAAERALDRALPALSAKQSLRFAFLPDGEDPDDLLRRGGKPAMDQILAARSDAEDTMWQLALARHGAGSAENIAALETEIMERASRIQDPAMKGAMRQAFKDRLYDLRGQIIRDSKERRQAQRKRRVQPPAKLSPELRSRLGQGGIGAPKNSAREAQLVIGLIHHPQLFHHFEEDILALTIEDPDLAKLWSRTVDALIGAPDLDFEGLRTQLSVCSEAESIYQRWSADPLVRTVRFIRRDAEDGIAKDGWRDVYLIDRRQKILNAEISEAGAEAHLDPAREKIWLNSVRLSLGAGTDRQNGSGGSDAA
ncbi:DNA primase [Parvularcula lutaonensis]|uniref:DNA primase n=1 Tax=Parvularcula lutaonensis TaxID=491923 RepID=A0ABV7MDA3_9PROT|nr:DNA primase [Parvularcula lutaonensis]GGY39982.1 DNA primase [Parvularcula lutaonensis]